MIGLLAPISLGNIIKCTFTLVYLPQIVNLITNLCSPCSPAHVMPLLEIVRTNQTSPQVVVDLLEVGKKIKKTPVVVGNCTGFAVNRMFFPYTQAGLLLVEHGADVYQIDRVITKFGMPMGPFRLIVLLWKIMTWWFLCFSPPLNTVVFRWTDFYILFIYADWLIWLALVSLLQLACNLLRIFLRGHLNQWLSLWCRRMEEQVIICRWSILG